MLTSAERNSLLLSLGFLLMGAGIKAWKKWRVEIGPFDPAPTAAAASLTHTAIAAPDTAEAPYHPAAAGPASPSLPRDSLPGVGAVSRAIGVRADSSQGRPAEALSRDDRNSARRGKPKSAKAPPACPVDPNSAPADRLAGLSGVGPRTAGLLVAHREAHGPFREIRDLLQVKGIGEKKLALIAPCLILSGAGASPPPAQAAADMEGDVGTGTPGP